MKNKYYIGFPMKDGCHVDGANMGIDILKDKIKFDKIINIEKCSSDLECVIKYDSILALEVDNAIKNDYMPIVIGGDHSLAIGSIAGVSKNYKIGVIWIDTHPDSNTNKTTTTFHIHGYPLGASMGFGQDELTNLYFDGVKVKCENVVMFGIDDIDEPEKDLIDKYNIKHFTYDDIVKYGIDYCIEDTINYLKDKVDYIHLSFDIDVISTFDSPGVSVPNRWDNGLSKNDALIAVDSFINKLNVVSMDIVEYNPLTDKDNKSLNIVLDTINIINKK